MLDILRPAASQVKPTPLRSASPSTSPASSTSTLKAPFSSNPPHPGSNRPKSPSKSSTTTARSRGQQARRQSFETAVSSAHRHQHILQDRHDDISHFMYGSSSVVTQSTGLVPLRGSTFSSDPRTTHRPRGHSQLFRSSDLKPAAAASPADPLHAQQSRPRKRSRAQKPLLGGLYFSDLIVVAFFYAVNLLRTCGIAELVDVAFKAFAYVCTRLPFDFYQRWSLSRPPNRHFGHYSPLNSSSAAQQPDSRTLKKQTQYTDKSAASAEACESRIAQPSRGSSTAALALATSSEDETSSQEAFQDDAQLSPFHHLTLLLVRFACTSFPHLVPRVLFAEETIGPLVRWRTGGGAAGIVREFTSEQASSELQFSTPYLLDGPFAAPSGNTKSKPKVSHTNSRPGFRAFWIGADAHVPVEVRRSVPASRSATTLLYLHGGGFSLGSVAFYAEALIRIITKVCGIEDHDNDARCVAVEYDLGPISRFPGPLLQCLRCYAHLVEVEGIDPTSITVAGDSAGGNLAMAMLLCLDGQARGDTRLAERDWSKLAMPGKAVLISPWADLRPHASLAFAPLRDTAAAIQASFKHSHTRSRASDGKGPDGTGDSTNVRVSAWTEAIGQHEWDYVAAEALMHFAQLYAGVLETPRRVRGPMGWVAHMCAVLAGDDQGSTTVLSTTNTAEGVSPAVPATAPLAILRTLLLPSQRIARAAHSILTEPLLNRANSAKPSCSSVARSATDAFTEIEHMRPSAVGALDPIFPAAERKTDAVPSTADLYIPIWNSPTSKHRKQEEEQEKDKRHRGDPNFEAAKSLLETSKLVNPAIGDWSRIKLNRGMLVLWGDRERLAEDIETWIDHVRQSQSTRRGQHGAGLDDQPSQDLDPAHSTLRKAGSGSQPKSLQERRAASRSPHRLPEDMSEEAAEWLCTAVEHGPGGVHAWPFVSMYLAGSESEREKGLEIIARFIAEPTPNPASTHPTTPSSPLPALAVQLPALHGECYASASANSPPHLNAVSPAGSMPSDISSRGEGEEYDYPFLGSSYTGSEGWSGDERNELGLEGVYPHETLWSEPTPTPSTGVGTPMESDGEQDSIRYNELVRRIGLGLGNGATRERGDAMMEPVHLHRPAHSGGSSWDRYIAPQRATARTAGRSSQPQTLGAPVGGRTLADLEAESDMSAPPSRPESPGWRDGSVGYDSDEDDLDATSPQELDRDDAYFGDPVSYADDGIPMDPGFYGLAHYHTLRPEGLSDIAEEESQVDTSSVISSGNGGAMSPGFSEPTFSPEGGRSPKFGATRANLRRYGPEFTPSAVEMARLREALSERERQYQERLKRRGRFPIEEDGEPGCIGDASDADVDWLDMERRVGEETGTNPWRLSAEVTLPAQSQDQHRNREAVGSCSNLTIALQQAGVASSIRDGDLQSPPSPARSTSSQTSSARDVWW